jgi:hypothetical protein
MRYRLPAVACPTPVQLRLIVGRLPKGGSSRADTNPPLLVCVQWTVNAKLPFQLDTLTLELLLPGGFGNPSKVCTVSVVYHK